MDEMLSGGLAKGRWAVIGMVTEGGNSSSDITFLQKSQGLVKKHSYFMQAVCTLLWIECIEIDLVVTYPLDQWFSKCGTSSGTQRNLRIKYKSGRVSTKAIFF